MLKSKASWILIIGIIFLSITSSLISFYPLLLSGPKAVFFNFEPEVAYVANALSYIGFKEISYAGHPATPSILAISYSFAPLRLYGKYVDHVPFFLWSIRNEFFLFYYVRIFESLIFALATGLFLTSIYKLTGQFRSVIFSWLGLFLYSNTPYLGIIPQSEPLSFLIISIWLIILCKFISRKTLWLYLILCILAGLSVANKLPNMFFVLASVMQVFSFAKIKLNTKVKYFFWGMFSSIVSFVIGTWPIRSQYASLWQWIVQLATHTGVHGGGQQSLFNLRDYLFSLNTLFSLEKWPAVLILTTLLFWILIGNKKMISLRLPINIFFSSLLLGILIFGKFSLSHYHQFHYIGILFISTYLITRLSNGVYYVLLTLVLIGAIKTTSLYWAINIKETNQAVALENFVNNNPSKLATVWEWARSSDYALIHIRDWVGVRYSVYLSPERKNLFSLSTDMNKVVISQEETKDVFMACWDQLYIQGSELPRFIGKYPKNKITSQLIPNSKDMWLITSEHCLKK